MTSTLAWLDHDTASRNRTKRILALFNERESRDELGLGAIRDSVSDLLFPVTSTIHTRLRYVLILPWVFQYVEMEGVGSLEIARRADELDRSLIDVLLASASASDWGIFGGNAGKNIKRLPSEVYWSVLVNWGILLRPISIDRYGEYLDLLRVRRREAEKRARMSKENRDEEDVRCECLWHSGMPDVPKGFPQTLDIYMRREESCFIQDRIRATHPQSLLAHLALYCRPADVRYPWMHPDLGSFSSLHREQLEHARLFAMLMHGTSVLYNLLLAECAGREELAALRRRQFIEWEGRVLSDPAVIPWIRSPEVFWKVVLGNQHVVTPATQNFVETWCSRVAERAGSLLSDKQALSLVREREIRKKGKQSRFTNQRLREQWGGSSGMLPMDYRWSTVKTLLEDLWKGLENAGP